jgi:hypothetical protein
MHGFNPQRLQKDKNFSGRRPKQGPYELKAKAPRLSCFQKTMYVR